MAVEYYRHHQEWKREWLTHLLNTWDTKTSFCLLMPNFLNEWSLFIASISWNLMMSFTTTMRLLSEMASDYFFICQIQHSFRGPHFSLCFGTFNTFDHLLHHRTLLLASLTTLCFEVCILTFFLFPILLHFLPSLEDRSMWSFSLHFLYLLTCPQRFCLSSICIATIIGKTIAWERMRGGAAREGRKEKVLNLLRNLSAKFSLECLNVLKISTEWCQKYGNVRGSLNHSPGNYSK